MISLFKNIREKNAKPIEKLEFSKFINDIIDGRWEDYSYGKIDKIKAPYITPSGEFSVRSLNGLIKHSGILNIDIDAKDNNDNVVELRDQLYADDFVYAGHLSISGNGLSLYVKINPDKHKDSWEALEKYFAEKYNIIIDPNAKDISRARFVSYDPVAHFNIKAKKWTKYIPKKEKQYIKPIIHVQNDIDFVLKQITDKRLDIAPEYLEWVKLGFAFVSEYGEAGRNYFHICSQLHHDYNKEKVDKKYSSLMKSGKRTGVSISTFFYYAKNHGCELTTQKTKHITKIGILRAKQNKGNRQKGFDSAIKYLKDIDKIEGDDVNDILHQVSKLTEKELNEIKDDIQESVVESLELFLKSYNIRYNEITQRIESEDGVLSERDVNTIYISALKTLGKGITKNLVFDLITSDFTKSYNPFIEFIKKYKHIKPVGNVDKIINCIDADMVFIDNDVERKNNDYVKTFLVRWLVSLIASIHGTYSILILVLTGEQGTGKTNFFRNLLPKELHSYYGESKLDGGKDDEILMTQKLILLDDEFGGKSKQEAKKLKDISSKEWFNVRKPYGRVHEDIKRLAVLCGTSNDTGVINDPTGNRRIIPIKINSIDWAAYEAIDKTALFIELYEMYIKHGNDWMLNGEDIDFLRRTTEKHEQTSIEYEMLIKYFSHDIGVYHEFTNTEIRVYLEARCQIKFSSYKIGQNLAKLGFQQTIKKVERATKRVYGVRIIDDRT